MAGAAVVVLTPDDLVRLRDDLLGDDDSAEERETKGQARPNVYYEAGFADALGRERTVIVEVGPVKSFSDAAGRHVVRYDGSAAKRNALAQRLSVAGLSVDTSGEGWLTAGDVGQAVAMASDALQKLGEPSATVIQKGVLLERIEVALGLLEELKRSSKYDDLSDLPDQSLEFVMHAQAILDAMPGDSTYTREAAAVRTSETHERIPVLAAALRTLRAEIN